MQIIQQCPYYRCRVYVESPVTHVIKVVSTGWLGLRTRMSSTSAGPDVRSSRGEALTMRAAAPAAPGLSRHSGLFSLSRVGVWKGSVSPFSETKSVHFRNRVS